MTILDDLLVPKVVALIDKYGATATFDGYNPPNYNPATGSGSPNTQEKAIDAKIIPPTPYEVGQIDFDLIRAGDAVTYLAASGLTFTPRIGMTVTLDTEVWRVVDKGDIRTGEQIALYELQLRK